MQEITESLKSFAERYTSAWCSQEPTRVASFFAPGGSLAINGARSSVGRVAIAEAARSFMAAFPDLSVVMDGLVPAGERIEFHWTLTGTNTGPGGSGNAVSISGFESWRIGPDGLIEESLGSFDAAEFSRQILGVAKD